MAWEHDCGTVVARDSVRPPEACEYCVAQLTAVPPHARASKQPKEWTGWRAVPASAEARKQHFANRNERHRLEAFYSKKRKGKKARTKARKSNGKNRPNISRGKRARIYKRDGYACVTCGFKPAKKDRATKLTIDHRVPLSRGGSNKDPNLQTMCGTCNHTKGNSMPADDYLAEAT